MMGHFEDKKYGLSSLKFEKFSKRVLRLVTQSITRVEEILKCATSM